MARTTPVNAGYTVVNGITTGSHPQRADTWLEYKITIGTSNITLNAKVYMARVEGESSSTEGPNGSGTITANGTTKKTEGKSYSFKTTTPNLFAESTFTFPLSTTSIILSGTSKTASQFISGGAIDQVTIQVYGNAVARIFVAGEWKNATPYIFTNGEWKMVTPYVFSNGEWKRGS